jgi:hypothetical protein
MNLFRSSQRTSVCAAPSLGNRALGFERLALPPPSNSAQHARYVSSAVLRIMSVTRLLIQGLLDFELRNTRVVETRSEVEKLPIPVARLAPDFAPLANGAIDPLWSAFAASRAGKSP